MSTETPEAVESGHGLSWPKEYLRDHAFHIIVILVLAAYPGIYSVLTNSPAAPVATLLLPPMSAMVTVMYFGLFAMSFDFITGYTGYASLGHAAFYGTGGYLVVLIANGRVPFVSAGTPFMLSLVIAGLVAVGLALLIGSVSFRLTGVYFAMITLGFAQVMYAAVRRADFLVPEGRDPAFGVSVNPDVPGFEIGIPFVDFVNLTLDNEMLAIGQLYGDTASNVMGLGIDFSSVEVSYYLIGGVVLISYFVMQRIIHSPFGSVMVAIRDNEERAEAVGFNVYWYKMAAFAISAFFAAIAGGLFAGFRRSISPDEGFFFLVTAEALLAAVIGGIATLAGSLYGAFIDELIRTFLSEASEIGLLPGFLEGHQILFLGLLLIVLVLYLPRGIVGWVRRRVGGKVGKQFGKKLSSFLENRL